MSAKAAPFCVQCDLAMPEACKLADDDHRALLAEATRAERMIEIYSGRGEAEEYLARWRTVAALRPFLEYSHSVTMVAAGNLAMAERSRRFAERIRVNRLLAHEWAQTQAERRPDRGGEPSGSHTAPPRPRRTVRAGA